MIDHRGFWIKRRGLKQSGGGLFQSGVRMLLRCLGKRGPIRGVFEESREYFDRRSVRLDGSGMYQEILPESVGERALPKSGPSKVLRRFGELQKHTDPKCFVLSIRGGRVLSDRGAILTPEHDLLFDVSNQMSVRKDFSKVGRHHAMRRSLLPPIRRISGRGVVLTTASGGNYFHWMTEALPRLRLLELAGMDFRSEFDVFIVNTGPAFIAESLELLGLGEAGTVRMNWNRHVELEDLVVPSLPGTTLNPPSWACRFLRDELLPTASGEGRGDKLFVLRGNIRRRRLENEEEIIELLGARGFQTVDPGALCLREQVRVFRDARYVVGVHGAALTNLIWCQPGTRILELLPDVDENSWFWPTCYWAIANACGLEYHCRVPIATEARPPLEPAEDSVVFAPEDIQSWLNEMGL